MEKSGHKDVASTIRLCRSIIEDVDSILATLPTEEAELPTWWTNKLAICYAYVNSLRDYIVYEGIEVEEDEASEDTDEEEGSEEDESENKSDESMIPPSVRMLRNAS
jgi:hypothetical protein